MQFEHASITAQLPLFNRRELKTEVSVASGATIGMGGLIGEKTEAFKDRVPVLGSIPLVGRLFRSEGERSVKRNLMIFVTASKVTPGGRILSERTYEK
jgi:general secretion pathway protein D